MSLPKEIKVVRIMDISMTVDNKAVIGIREGPHRQLMDLDPVRRNLVLDSVIAGTIQALKDNLDYQPGDIMTPVSEEEFKGFRALIDEGVI